MKSTTLTPMKAIYLFLLVLAIGFFATAFTALAAERNGDGAQKAFRANLSEEQLEILDEARKLRDSGDFEEAQTLVEEAGIEMPVRGEHDKDRPELTDEQKDILDQAHGLMNNGDTEAAKKLLADNDIDMPMRGMHKDNEEHEAVKAAIEAGDYTAFKEATADAPVEMDLNEEQFQGMVEAHKLRESGDFEAARALMDELDLPQPGKRAHKHFVQNLSDEDKATIQEAHQLAKDGDIDAAQELLEDNGIALPEKEGFFKRIFGKKS
ncbi:hypothetical protein H6776_02615 [Candidatus Nomurabacteria bacterium]|nr:hypothetical protein [Candidatus Nomurabacteria bacterium]